MAAPGFIILLICAAIALILTIIAAPMDVVKSTVSNTCVTLWGLKLDCATAQLSFNTYDMPVCDDIRSRVRAASGIAVLAVISLIVTVVLTLLGLLCKLGWMRIVSALVGFLAAIFLLIAYGLAISVYLQVLCGTQSLSDSGNWKYGSAFGLVVAAFCVVTLGSIVQLVLKADFGEPKAN